MLVDMEENLYSSDAMRAFKFWCDEGDPQTPSDIAQMPLPPAPAPLPPVKKPFQLLDYINVLFDSGLFAYRTAVLKLNSN